MVGLSEVDVGEALSWSDVEVECPREVYVSGMNE